MACTYMPSVFRRSPSVLAAVGLFSGALAALPRPGPWMVWIQRVAGVVLLLMAEYYFVQMGKVL